MLLDYGIISFTPKIYKDVIKFKFEFDFKFLIFETFKILKFLGNMLPTSICLNRILYIPNIYDHFFRMILLNMEIIDFFNKILFGNILITSTFSLF